MFDKLPNEIKKYIFDINRQDAINIKNLERVFLKVK